MARRSARKLLCPICKKPVKASDVDFPFCSERCRTLDLGRWASGSYVISSPAEDTTDRIADPGMDPDEV